jgi:hypothetical protein
MATKQRSLGARFAPHWSHADVAIFDSPGASNSLGKAIPKFVIATIALTTHIVIPSD